MITTFATAAVAAVALALPGVNLNAAPGCASDPLIVAHRGAHPGNITELGMKSFDKAVEVGADSIEMDFQRDKGHHLIVMHDDTLNRTTNGSGYLANKTLAQLSQLRLDDGGKIPTGKDWFTWLQAHPTMLADVELKSTIGAAEINLMVKMIATYHVRPQVHITSTTPSILRLVRDRVGDRFPLVLVVKHTGDATPADALEFGGEVALLNDVPDFQPWHDAGLEIEAETHTDTSSERLGYVTGFPLEAVDTDDVAAVRAFIDGGCAA